MEYIKILSSVSMLLDGMGGVFDKVATRARLLAAEKAQSETKA